jgi:acetyl esterase/lipase
MDPEHPPITVSKADEPTEQKPRIQPELPLLTRFSYNAQLWAIQSLVTTSWTAATLFKHPATIHGPTHIKSYPSRPHLSNRIFIPKNHKDGEVHPLYLDIHGGGFAICEPRFDDEFCYMLAQRRRYVVVSLDYSKSPSYQFPTPVYDIGAVASAAIDDPALPIDRSHVAIGGFSAGGNLALAGSQLPERKGKIRAAVTFYPVVDWETSRVVKLKRRPYKKPEDVDMLASMATLFDWGYVPAGTDFSLPLLSVKNAKPEDLPPWIYTISAEYDMLAQEACEMMCKLAGIEEPTEEERYEFNRGTYRWKLTRDVVHGFTHVTVGWEIPPMRVDMLEKVVDEVGEWLERGAFAG